MDLQLARSNMTEQQVRPWDVLDQQVLDVLSEIPRETFVASQYRGIAYSDFELPIGHEQHMLKPTLDGRLLQSLLLSATDTALEIGTGSGYLTTCLAQLCSHVDSIDNIAALAETARIRLTEQGVANARILHQDASVQWNSKTGYDAIAFSGSIMSVPDFYRQKLNLGGRLFAVIGEPTRPTMEAIVMTRVKDNEWSTESLFETRIEPLVNFVSESQSFVF